MTRNVERDPYMQIAEAAAIPSIYARPWCSIRRLSNVST